MTTPTTTRVAVDRLTIATPSGVVATVRDAVLANTAGLRDAILSVVGNTRDVYQRSGGTWPTVTRRSWLSYRWIARYNTDILPTVDNGVMPGDQIVGFQETFFGTEPYSTPDGA